MGGIILWGWDETDEETTTIDEVEAEDNHETGINHLWLKKVRRLDLPPRSPGSHVRSRRSPKPPKRPWTVGRLVSQDKLIVPMEPTFDNKSKPQSNKYPPWKTNNNSKGCGTSTVAIPTCLAWQKIGSLW